MRVLRVPETRHGFAAYEKRKPSENSIEDDKAYECVNKGIHLVNPMLQQEDSPIKLHSVRVYHLWLLNRSRKKAIEIFNNPSPPMADIILCQKAI
jgi:hypothetical protein